MKCLNDFLEDFEKYINDTVLCDDEDLKPVADSMRYSLLAGGKRIRPFLLNSFFLLCGGKGKIAYSFAAAVEMIHTYSLIHDDLPCMDNDDFRRGKPSNHKKFGESTALLAGDALLTEAFLLASSNEYIPDNLKIKAIKSLAYNSGYKGMVGGQIIDLSSEGKHADGNVITKLNLLKTGALLKTSCEIGCIIAGADDAMCSAASNYGEKIGLAFQIIDDILDATADEKTLGKSSNSDIKNNKSTFVSEFGIEYCSAKAEELTREAINALSFFKSNTDNLKQTAEYLLKRKF